MAEGAAGAQRSQRHGLLMIFTGDGKGKTTAAIGMAVRAVGHDMRVHMVQFMKHKWRYGELAAIARLAPQFELVRHGAGFTLSGKDELDLEHHRRVAEEALAMALEAITIGGYDMIVLDEVCTTIYAGLLQDSQVLTLVEVRPPDLHLVLTGRGATPSLIEAADLVTEMREVKHPYRQGIKAQRGVEF